jgi:hypothetical protein
VVPKIIALVNALANAPRVGLAMIAVLLIRISYVPVVNARTVVLKHMLMVNVDVNVLLAGQVLIVVHRIRIFYAKACIVKTGAPKHSSMVNVHVNVHLVGQDTTVAHQMWVFYVHQRLATMVVLKIIIMVNAAVNVPLDLKERTVLNVIARRNIAEPAVGMPTLVNVIVNRAFLELLVQPPIRLLFALVLIVQMELKDIPGDNVLVHAKMVGRELIAIWQIRPFYVDRRHVCLVKAIKLTITAPVPANACLDGKDPIVARKIVVPPAV